MTLLIFSSPGQQDLRFFTTRNKRKTQFQAKFIKRIFLFHRFMILQIIIIIIIIIIIYFIVFCE